MVTDCGVGVVEWHATAPVCCCAVVLYTSAVVLLVLAGTTPALFVVVVVCAPGCCGALPCNTRTCGRAG